MNRLSIPFLIVLTTMVLGGRALAQDPPDTEPPPPETTAVSGAEGGGEGSSTEGAELTPSPAVEDPKAEELPDKIKLVPAGSVLVVPALEGGELRYKVPRKSFLLPELHYDNALIKVKQLAICQPALDKCTDTSLEWQKRTYDALTECSNQFDSDEALIQDLTSKFQSMETRALVAEDRLKVARKNQAVAWGITGGLVLGAVTAIVVTVANSPTN